MNTKKSRCLKESSLNDVPYFAFSPLNVDILYYHNTFPEVGDVINEHSLI